MNRKIILLLALILVVVQTLSVWHMAEHAFCKHKHDGKNCEISLVFEQAKSTGSGYKIQLVPVNFFIIKNIQASYVPKKLAVYSESYPRAPPCSRMCIT